MIYPIRVTIKVIRPKVTTPDSINLQRFESQNGNNFFDIYCFISFKSQPNPLI